MCLLNIRLLPARVEKVLKKKRKNRRKKSSELLSGIQGRLFPAKK